MVEKRNTREMSKELTHWMSAGNSSKLKHALFSTFHRILDDLIISETTAKSLIIIQIIQLTTIITNEKNPILAAHISSGVLRFIKIPLAYPFFLEFDQIYSTMTLIPILLLILWIIWGFLSIYKLPEKEHKKYGGLKQNYGMILYLLDTVLICPLFGILIKLSLCGSSSPAKNAPECLSSTHIILLLITFTFALILITIVITVGLFYFNYFFKQRDALARSSNIMHLMFRVYQIGVVAVDLLIFDQEQKFRFNLFIHTIFSIIFCIDYYNRLPYYNTNVSEYYCFGIYSYFWITNVLLIAKLANMRLILQNVIYIILIGQIFFLYIVKTFREYFYRQLVIREIEEINNEIHLDVRFRYLINIVKNSKKNKQDELLLTSLIKVHTEKCTNSRCACKNRDSLYDPKEQKASNPDAPHFKDSVFVKSYLLMLIKKSVQKNTKSSLLNIDYFLFLFEEMSNIGLVNKSILIFERQFNNNLFITVQYAIYRMRISVYYHIKKMNKSEKISRIQFENIRVYDNYMDSLKDNCLKTIDRFSRMWDILNHPAPDLKQLELVCTKLTDLKRETSIIYQNLLAISRSSLEFLSLMIIYANFIIFDDQMFSEVNEAINPIMPSTIDDSVKHLEKDSDLLYANMQESCGSIYLSFNYENLGQIVYVSRSCEKIFRYDRKYLKTFNISFLQPEMVAVRHDLVLKDRLEIGKSNIMRKQLHLWGMDKNRDCFSMLIAVKPFIAEEGLTISSIVKKLNGNDYLLLNERGEINGMGKKVKKLLGITNEMLEKEHMFSFLLYCPVLIPFFLPKLYNQKEFDFTNIPLAKMLKKKDSVYMFVSAEHLDRLVKISDALVTLRSRFKKQKKGGNTGDFPSEFWHEYCKIIHEDLKNLRIRDLKKCYKILIRMKKFVYSRNIVVWEIKFENVRKMKEDCMRQQIWKREMSFIEKLDMSNTRIKEIKKYSDKILGIETDDKNNRGYDAAKKLFGGARRGSVKKNSMSSLQNFSMKYGKKEKKLEKKVSIMDDVDKPKEVKPKKNLKIGKFSKKLGNRLKKDHSPSNDKNSANKPIKPSLKPKVKFGNKLSKLKIKVNNKSPVNKKSEEPKKKGKKMNKLMGGGIGGVNKKKNLFSRIQLGKVNGKISAEEKLKIALDFAPPAYTHFQIDENIEEDLLEEKTNVTYHESDNQSILDLMELEKFEQVNLKKKKEKRKMKRVTKPRFGLKLGQKIMEGSVGSQQSRFSHRDTIKKIRLLIFAKRAPKILKTAFIVLVIGLLLCIGIGVLSYGYSNYYISDLEEFIKETHELSIIGLKFNKITTYLELNLLEHKNQLLDFEKSYGSEVYKFMKNDAENSLEEAKLSYDKRVTALSDSRTSQETLAQYLFLSETYKIKTVELDLPILSFYSTVLQAMMEYFRTIDKKEKIDNVKILTENLLTEINVQNEIYNLAIQMKEDLLNDITNLSYFGLFSRYLLVIICSLIAFPFMYKASLKSGEILLQLSKISQINITFYMQHYNKLSMLLKAYKSTNRILEKAENHYNTEYRLKQFREQITGYTGAARFAKLNTSDRSKWALIALGFISLILALQSGKAAQFFFHTNKISNRLDKTLLIVEISKSVSAFNALSLKIMSMKLEGVKGEEYETGMQMAEKIDAFLSEGNKVLTEARKDIYDVDFSNKLTEVLDSNLCEVIFDKNGFEKCFEESKTLGSYSIRAYLSEYQISTWNRFKYIKESLKNETIISLLQSDLYKIPLFNMYWMEQSLDYWEHALIDQFSRFVKTDLDISLAILVAEAVLLFTVILVLSFKKYYQMKNNILYSLSFLLLVPFHIFKENESFSSFIKRMIDYQNII